MRLQSYSEMILPLFSLNQDPFGSQGMLVDEDLWWIVLLNSMASRRKLISYMQARLKYQHHRAPSSTTQLPRELISVALIFTFLRL